MMNPPSTTARDAVATKGARRRNGAWRKAVPYAVGAGIVLLVIAGLWPKPARVETAAIIRGPLTVSVLEEGKTRIRHRYVISPPVAGFLNRVPHRQGSPITAGKTVLATVEPQPSGFLDPRSRAQAEARLDAAEAARMNRQAQVERANEALELARKDLARADALRRSGAIAQQEWDTADNRVKLLTRELHASEFALRVAEFEISQARAALLELDTPSDGKSEPLQIVAPVDGYVLNVFEESARVVTPGMPIMEVGDPRDLEAEIEMLSSDAVMVRPGAEAIIEHWGGPEPLRGHVTVVEPGGYTKFSALGVEEQRTLVRVDFLDLPEGLLGDRYRVEARIVTWHGDDVLQVPTGALFRRGGDWMTFTVENGRARERKVVIGHNSGTAAEVLSGLSEGERVILHPPDTIRDGIAVSER